MNKKLIITLIIIFTLIGTCSTGYIIHDKHIKEKTQNNKKQTNQSTKNKSLKEKTYTINYNNQEHQVRIEYIEKIDIIEDEEEKNGYYQIYIDNKLINTELTLGYVSEEEYDTVRKDIMDLNEVQIKTLNNKYLVIVLPQIQMKISYTAYFYNDNKMIKSVVLQPAGTGGYDNKTEANLTSIEQVKFNNDNIQYYDYCSLTPETEDENGPYKISFVTLTFDGTKINKKIENTVNDISAGGSGDAFTYCE